MAKTSDIYVLVHQSVDGFTSFNLFGFTPNHPYNYPDALQVAHILGIKTEPGDELQLLACNGKNTEATFNADKHTGSKKLYSYTTIGRDGEIESEHE